MQFPSNATFRKLTGLALSGYWFALFVATHIPLPDRLIPPKTDKIIHCAAYFVLAVLFSLYFRLRGYTRWRTFCVVLVTLVIWGAVDEVLQIPIPGRFGDVADVIADAVGTILGAATSLIVIRRVSPDATAGE